MFEWDIPKTPPEPKQRVNPCIAVYGPGPDDTQCKTCIHCRYPLQRSLKRYWKCDLRKLTHSRSSDHRVTWPTCGRYEQRITEYHGG